MGSKVSRSTSRTSASKPRQKVCSCRAQKVTPTSLGDFSKGQAGASLKLDIFRVHEGTESPQRISGEEVGFGSLDSGQYMDTVRMS